MESNPKGKKGLEAFCYCYWVLKNIYLFIFWELGGSQDLRLPDLLDVCVCVCVYIISKIFPRNHTEQSQQLDNEFKTIVPAVCIWSSLLKSNSKYIQGFPSLGPKVIQMHNHHQQFLSSSFSFYVYLWLSLLTFPMATTSCRQCAVFPCLMYRKCLCIAIVPFPGRVL